MGKFRAFRFGQWNTAIPLLLCVTLKMMMTITVCVFHTIFGYRSFTEVGVRVCLLRCPGIISAVLSYAVVWMVSILPLTSSSSCSDTRTSRTVQRAPSTISITVTLIFYIFSSLSKSKYLFTYLISFIFTFGPPKLQNPLNGKFTFFVD